MLKYLPALAGIVSTVAVLAAPAGLEAAGARNAAAKSAAKGAKGDGLVKYAIKDDAIAASLTGKPGNPKQGRKVAINRKLGNCLGCHKMPIPEQSFHGRVGPDLKGVGSRYNEGELRLRIVNPKVVNEETMMPAYYRLAGLHRVAKAWKGKTILNARQVEDLVAYLKTLKE